MVIVHGSAYSESVARNSFFCEYSTEIHKEITEVIILEMKHTENEYSILQALIFPGQTSLIGHMVYKIL